MACFSVEERLKNGCKVKHILFSLMAVLMNRAG